MEAQWGVCAQERQYRDRQASLAGPLDGGKARRCPLKQRWYVGVDWGSQTHQVCVIDAGGEVVGERAFEHGGRGLAALAAPALTRTGSGLPLPEPPLQGVARLLWSTRAPRLPDRFSGLPARLPVSNKPYRPSRSHNFHNRLIYIYLYRHMDIWPVPERSSQYPCIRYIWWVYWYA